ncbi:hypothetical protein ABIB66_008038 [Bradyrhizobium sp. F1.13.3]
MNPTMPPNMANDDTSGEPICCTATTQDSKLKKQGHGETEVKHQHAITVHIERRLPERCRPFEPDSLEIGEILRAIPAPSAFGHFHRGDCLIDRLPEPMVRAEEDDCRYARHDQPGNTDPIEIHQIPIRSRRPTPSLFGRLDEERNAPPVIAIKPLVFTWENKNGIVQVKEQLARHLRRHIFRYFLHPSVGVRFEEVHFTT